TVTMCYNGATTNCVGASNISYPITRRDTYTTIAGMSVSNHVAEFFDSYGNVTKAIVYDFGATSPTRTVDMKIGSWNGTACVAVGNNINDRICSKSVYNGSDSGGILLSSETFSYNSKGHLLSHVMGTTTSGVTGPKLTEGYTYNPTGTVATATDVNGAVAQINYNGTGGCNNLLRTSTVFAGLTISYQWNCDIGKVTKVTDPNGSVTQYAYDDSLLRLTQTTDPMGNTTTNTYLPTTMESVLAFVNPASSTSTVDILTALDGLGRPVISQKRQSPGASTFDTVVTTYDNVGRVASVGQPCLSTTAFAGCSSLATTTTYDALNRPLQVTDPGGGYTKYAYTGRDVLMTRGPAPSGENLKKRQFEYDALGRIASVCEITSATGSGPCSQDLGGTGYITQYTYDNPANSFALTQNGTQTRSYQYDAIGRLTSESNPENGTTSYTYDALSVNPGLCTAHSSFGDLIQTVDANGNGTCYKWDQLHRMLSIGESYNTSPNASVTPDHCFVYDAAIVNGATMSNPKGRLAEAFTTAHNAGCSATKITDEGF